MREDGVVIVGGKEIASTRQCVHCGGHFTMVKGSGRTRGWCLRCQGVTCGHADCDPCIPFEARLDHAEGKRSSYTETILDQFGIPIGQMP